MLNPHKFDVLVIGGGPAGSSAATLLAKNGRKVALFEKELFPRYHVGESMIPYCYFPLQKLGMIDKLKKSNFMKKYSVQFASPRGKLSQPFYFQEHLDHEASQSWQVKRSEFDKMMIENAVDNGVSVYQGYRVKESIEANGAVVGLSVLNGENQKETFHAPLTIDASGRNGFFATKNGWRVMDANLKKVAIWTYYKGAKRDEGIDEGATTVAYIPEKGWFWYIPMADDVVSVGLVANKSYLYRNTRDPREIMDGEITNNKWIETYLDGAEQFGEYWVTGDYSYRSKYCAADGVVLAGDAFAFLDPVFSTGMLLALTGGDLVAQAAEKALQSNDFSAHNFIEYGEIACRAIEDMRKLVYSFYDSEFNFRIFFEKYGHMRADVTDILIGNTNRSYQELFTAMQEFLELPEDLSYGKPLLNSKITETV